MSKEFPTPAERARQNRESAAIAQAVRTGKSSSYIDDDGCEVTVTAGGNAFYNAQGPFRAAGRG